MEACEDVPARRIRQNRKHRRPMQQPRTSLGFNALRNARVFFARSNLGLYFILLPVFVRSPPAFFFNTCLRISVFALVFKTVSTRAMFFRTTLILESFEAAPPVTLATRSCTTTSLTVKVGKQQQRVCVSQGRNHRISYMGRWPVRNSRLRCMRLHTAGLRHATKASSLSYLAQLILQLIQLSIQLLQLLSVQFTGF